MIELRNADEPQYDNQKELFINGDFVYGATVFPEGPDYSDPERWSVYFRQRDAFEKLAEYRFSDLPECIIYLYLFKVDWSGFIDKIWFRKWPHTDFRFSFSLKADLSNWKKPYSFAEYEAEFVRICKANIHATLSIGHSGIAFEFPPASLDTQIGIEFTRCADIVRGICQEVEKSFAPFANINTYDVALSFAGEDREYVERVATLLRDAGIRVFYDRFEEANLWGKNLSDHLAQVYATSRFVVMFVSTYYAAKAWPNHERKHAQARALKNQEDIILPARFDDTIIPGLPDSVAYVDLRRMSAEGLVERIITKLKGSL